jgi:hypothetical protein
MEATLHGQDVLATQFAEDKTTGMSLYGTDWKIGYLLVGNNHLLLYLL